MKSSHRCGQRASSTARAASWCANPAPSLSSASWPKARTSAKSAPWCARSRCDPGCCCLSSASSGEADNSASEIRGRVADPAGRCRWQLPPSSRAPDSGGGAGIQADIKTASAFGVYAMTAVTAVTAQNTKRVQGDAFRSACHRAEQIAATLSDIGADAIKIGMLGNGRYRESRGRLRCASTRRKFPSCSTR